MAGDVLHPLEVSCRDRLLDELDVQALLLHLVEDADSLLCIPRLIGVDAELDVLAHGLADGGQTGHVQLWVDAHLDLQAVITALDGGAGVPGHLLGRVDADGDVRHDIAARAAQHPVDRGAVLLAQQVPQGHIHGSLGAGVVDEGLLHGGGQILELVEVAAQDGRGDVVADGADDGTGGVAGDDAGGRCLTVAHRAGVGVQLNDDVLHAAHGAQRCLEGDAERGRDTAQLYLCDLHASPSLFFLHVYGGRQLLIGDAGRAVFHMDDAAAGKTVLLEKMLHDLVVGVGVGPQALAVLEAPCDDLRRHAPAVTRRGQPVDGAVRHLIVEPLAVFDFRVGGVRPEDEGKHRLETAVHRIDEQPVGVDVFFQHLLRRIAVAPLGRVARIRHCFPGMSIDL